MKTMERRISAALLATIFVATTATACVITTPKDLPSPGASQTGTTAPTETTSPPVHTQAGTAPSEEACTEALLATIGGDFAEGNSLRLGDFDVLGLQEVIMFDCELSFDINPDSSIGVMEWDNASLGVVHAPAPGDKETIEEWFIEEDGWKRGHSQISPESIVKEDTSVAESGTDSLFKYGEVIQIYELTDLAQPEQIESYEEITGAKLADDAFIVLYAKGYVVTEQ